MFASAGSLAKPSSVKSETTSFMYLFMGERAPKARFMTSASASLAEEPAPACVDALGSQEPPARTPALPDAEVGAGPGRVTKRCKAMPA